MVFLYFILLMKSVLIIFIVFFSTIYGYSQLSVFNRFVQFNQKTDVHPVTSNPELGLPIIFIGGNNINVFYLQDEYEDSKEVAIKKASNNTKHYVGSFFESDSSLALIFFSKKLHFYSKLSVNLISGCYSENDYQLSNSNQMHINSWEVKDSLYVLTVLENSSELTLFKFSGNNQVSEYNYHVGKDIQVVLGVNSLYEFVDSDEGRIQKIINTMPVNMYLASAKNKSYLVGNEIILSFDSHHSSTFLLKLSIGSNRFDIVEYPITDKTYLEFSKSNSFYYQNTLFQIGINDDYMGFIVRDIDNKDRIGNFGISKGEKIDFANTGIIRRNEKEGFLYGTPVIRNISNTKKFFRLASTMNPAISVFKNKDNCQINLGTVENIQQSGGVSARTLIVSGGKMTSGMGSNLVMPESVYYFPSNYSFTSYSTRISIGFSTIVNLKDYKHNPIPITKYTYNYIVDYANLMHGNQGMVTIFKFKGDYYLGYYTYGSNTYNLEWFKNVDDYSIQY